MNVPILMYHSVSNNQQRLWGHLSCPVKVFEDHLQILAKRGFTTISLQEMYDHYHHSAPLPSHPIVLTFDDGYLDNWVYAYPILKRYGFRGAIFVNPDFVDPAEELRPNLDDVSAGKVSASALKSVGFLSWAEMKTMDTSGVMDIQSHSLTHTWYFSDNQIVDFHHPGDSYPWLAWNARPDRKYAWLDEDQATFAPWGTPVYVHDKALVARRYFPDSRLAEFMATQVAKLGDASFFQKAGWREQLLVLYMRYRDQYSLNERRESDAEYEARVRHELGDAREIIASKLGKSVNFLCWPGGGYNETTERIAREVGYLAATISSKDPRRLKPEAQYLIRWGAPTLIFRSKHLFRSGQYLMYMLGCQRGHRLSCLGCKVLSGYDMAFLTAQLMTQFINRKMTRKVG